MTRGRKPKPSHLRLIGGNAGRRPINSREPRVPPAMPTPPSVLNETARGEWRRVIGQLAAVGLVTTLDRAALAAYCQVYGLWFEAERALLTEGLVIETSNGNFIQNPLIGIARRARVDMVRFAAEFGMTPSARSRVQVDPFAAQKLNDPAAKFLR